MEEDLISVIVPIYNSQRFIRYCVASVLAQTYPYFEIILIDDGSCDKSLEICQRMYRNEERIRLICQEHSGVSTARNRGLVAAEGKYVFFIDSDDIIHPQLLESLHGLLKEKGAVIGTQRRYRIEGKKLERPEEWRLEDIANLENIYLKNEEALECNTFASSQTALSGIGGKMILADAVGSIRFDEKLTHGEDTLFMYQVLAGGADVVVLCRDWYCYRKHEKGTISKLTVKGCGSIYEAECRIRDQEVTSGREENALIWEQTIVNTIMGWYKTGRESNNDELMSYVKDIVNVEKKREMFSRLRWWKRLEFVTSIYGYPICNIYKLYLFLDCLGRYYRKILNQVHIHRWRVRWVYKNIKWKAVWLEQMIRIMIRRGIGKTVNIGHFIIDWKEHLDEKKKG